MFAGRLIEQQEDCTHAYHVQFPTKKIFGGFWNALNLPSNWSMMETLNLIQYMFELRTSVGRVPTLAGQNRWFQFQLVRTEPNQSDFQN
jgi:hypothetical protein